MARFVAYVEGPRDREILRGWAGRVSPPFGRALAECCVILGGRRPARAVEHFLQLGAEGAVRGLCVLDRDGGDDPSTDIAAPAGLEFFVWPRRHIESYLLVPDAIRRFLRASRDDPRVARSLRAHLPAAGDEPSLRTLHAKRLLSESGTLCREVGRRLPTGAIARAMRASELHPDVIGLLNRMRSGLGLREPQRPVVTHAR